MTLTSPTPRWLARHIAAAHDTDPEREGFVPARLGGSSAGPPVRLGNYATFLGDSITLGHDDPANGVHGDSWPTYAGLLSGQRIQTVYNAGVSGNTSAQMLARFTTDVTPHAPSVVTLLAGTNDIGNGVPFADYQANIRALVGRIRGTGAGPVLGTIPPNDDSDARRTTIALWNLWLRLYAAQQSIPLLDFHAVLTDPATGRYAAGLTADGTHPSDAGYLAMGAHAAAVLAPQLPSAFPPLPVVNAEPQNLLADGLFLDAPTAGVAGGWVPYGSPPAGATASVTTDPAVLGKLQRVTHTGSAGDMLLYQSLGVPGGGKYSAGDVLAVTGVLTTAGIGADCRLTFWPGGATAVGVTQDITRGRFYSQFTVPPAATTCDFLLYYRAGTGYAEFGRMGVYNLTALGLI